MVNWINYLQLISRLDLALLAETLEYADCITAEE